VLRRNPKDFDSVIGHYGRATLVVTGDPDLLALEEHQGVRIVNPRAFLRLLGG